MISGDSKKRIQSMLADLADRKAKLEAYIAGLRDGLGLPPEAKFDVNTMEFKEVPKDEK